VLISTRTTFAIRCPQCGQLEVAAVSRFECGKGSQKLYCSCGAHKLTAGRQGDQVYMQVPCYLCDGMHFLYMPVRQFWSGGLRPILCSETELQVGVVGPETEVAYYARPNGGELDQFMDETAHDDYFQQPDIMYEALSRVHELDEAGNVSCKCGGRRVMIDLYPERLVLSCPDCGRHRPVPAVCEEDLAALDRFTRLEVGDDSPGRRQGHNK
jgi:hypothetical protein